MTLQANRGDVRTVPVTVPVPQGRFKLTEYVCRSVFSDQRIPIYGGFRRSESDAESAKVEFDIPVEDFDEAMFAVGKARDQIRARLSFEEKTAAKPQRKTVVVNLFGGPGAGKSTAAFEITASLKKDGYIVEYAPEYAKELVWTIGDEAATPSEREFARTMLDGSLKHQELLYSNQLSRIRRCVGQCDFVVTDSPIILSAIYLKTATPEERERFERMALADMSQFTNFNFFVERSGSYEQEGRVHNEEQAREIDGKIVGFLKSNNIYYGSYGREKTDVAVRNMKKTHEKQKTVPQAAGRGEMTFPVPKILDAGSPSLRRFSGKDGNSYVEVTLPDGIGPIKTENGLVDVSGATFIMRDGDPGLVCDDEGKIVGRRYGNVLSLDEDARFYEVVMPSANSKGKPWTVSLRLGRALEQGAQVPSIALARAMRDYRDSCDDAPSQEAHDGKRRFPERRPSQRPSLKDDLQLAKPPPAVRKAALAVGKTR